MTERGDWLPPAPVISLGVVGHRDLAAVDRHVLRATVTRFLGQLRRAVDQSLVMLERPSPEDPCRQQAPMLLMVNSLAEGADQLVAEEAGASGYRLWCPIPFTRHEYKSYFTEDRERSLATFDRLISDPNADVTLVELECSGSDEDRSAGYAAAAAALLENSDLLFALHDPSRIGSSGGTAETIAKAIRSGLPVVGIDLRSPEELHVLGSGAGSRMDAEQLTEKRLYEIVDGIMRGRLAELKSLKRAARRPNRS